MTLLGLIIAFVVWGLVIWLARTQIKDAMISRIVIICATVLLILLLLWAAGLLGFLYTPIGRRG